MTANGLKQSLLGASHKALPPRPMPYDKATLWLMQWPKADSKVSASQNELAYILQTNFGFVVKTYQIDGTQERPKNAFGDRVRGELLRKHQRELVIFLYSGYGQVMDEGLLIGYVMG